VTGVQTCALPIGEAYRRLTKLGLVKAKGRGFFQTTKPLSISSEVSSTAIQSYHLQNLDKAKASLEKDVPELRDFSSVTMGVDNARLAEAKKEIKAFRRKMAKLLSQTKNNQVYTLAIQLFPVSH